MRVLGLIPARGGSKSIPRKNLALLAGRPLLQYACEAGLGSASLDRVLLDTDDEEIAAAGRSFGVEAPYLRPAHIAADETPMLDVLVHSLEWLRDHEGYAPDAVALLQPTSPLRRAEHVDGAVNELISSGADTVVSVIVVPHQFSPASVMRLDESGNLHPYETGPLILRRQDKPRVYARNGPAVLVTRRAVLEGGRLYGDTVRPFEMAERESIDIDDTDDLALADFWLARRLAHGPGQLPAGTLESA